MEVINFKGYVFVCDRIDLVENELFIKLIKDNLITSKNVDEEEVYRITNYNSSDGVILADINLSTLLSEVLMYLDEPYFPRALKLLESNHYGCEKIDIYYIDDTYYIEFLMFR